MKQTAVEWLVEQITNGDISARQAIQQAKEMEKEQIVNAVDSWVVNGNLKGEQYYKETYESKTNL